ncbi:MAG: EamA family transporter [Acidobacteria bacterium]|nr:EamA family transporter [Acidobacteriota bacterium]
MTDAPDPAPARTGLPVTALSAVLAVGVAVTRGGNQVAIKVALTAMAPLWTAFWRMFISCLTIFVWSRIQGVQLWPERHQWRHLCMLSLIFFTQIAMLHTGADWTSPGYATALINTAPIFANLVSPFFVPQDRLTWTRVAGLAIAFGGACGVLLGRPDAGIASRPLLGNVLVTISGCLVGARSVYIQRIVQNMPSSRAMFWQIGMALPGFALGAWLIPDPVERQPLSAAPLLALLYQGVFVGGLALIVWVYLLKRHTPGSITAFSFATPIAGLVMAAWLFQESLGPRLLLGLLAVLVGIALVSRPTDRPQP